MGIFRKSVRTISRGNELIKSSKAGLNSQITHEFLGTCPKTVGVGGKEEAM